MLKETAPASVVEVPNINVETPNVKDKDCKDKDCGQCLKGGMPMRRESLSLVALFLVGLTTLMSVLWINEKRKIISLQVDTGENVVTQEQMKTYEMPKVKTMSQIIDLPQPKIDSSVSIEETFISRRSRRTFSVEPVSLDELSQILWAAQGITDENNHRTAPSGKGAYPYTLYVVARNIDGLSQGLYQYLPEKHQLGNLGIANAGDLLIQAEVQDAAQKAPAVIVMSAAYAKMLEVFPDSDPHKNTYLEGGHIGQNIYLQVESLGMSTVVMGGFNSKAVGDVLQLDEVEDVVYLVPFGHRANEIIEE